MSQSVEADPAAADIDAVLAFLPELEAPGFDPAAPDADPGEPASALARFVEALQDHHFISSFDWTPWQAVAGRYVSHPELLADAGLGTIRKLFTTHVGQDRVSQGHLVEVVRSGHVAAVLRRLRDIRGQLPTARA